MVHSEKTFETTKELAAARQIVAAIEHCWRGEFEAAITLGSAAEGCLPVTEEPHLLKKLNDTGKFKKLAMNDFINWMKHPGGAKTATISEFEVVVTIVRAVSKFLAHKFKPSSEMKEFLSWAADWGHLPTADWAELQSRFRG